MVYCGCGQGTKHEACYSISWQTPEMRSPAHWPTCQVHFDEDWTYFAMKRGVIMQYEILKAERVA
jgi:hypothetical protein